jgi:hypothetical protein
MVAYINAGDAADAEHLVRELFLVLGSTQSPMRSETVSVLESFKFSLRLARTGHATVCLNWILEISSTEVGEGQPRIPINIFQGWDTGTEVSNDPETGTRPQNSLETTQCKTPQEAFMSDTDFLHLGEAWSEKMKRVSWQDTLHQQVPATEDLPCRNSSLCSSRESKLLRGRGRKEKMLWSIAKILTLFHTLLLSLLSAGSLWKGRMITLLLH